jgi:hypothetical protein
LERPAIAWSTVIVLSRRPADDLLLTKVSTVAVGGRRRR